MGHGLNHLITRAAYAQRAQANLWERVLTGPSIEEIESHITGIFTSQDTYNLSSIKSWNAFERALSLGRIDEEMAENGINATGLFLKMLFLNSREFNFIFFRDSINTSRLADNIRPPRRSRETEAESMSKWLTEANSDFFGKFILHATALALLGNEYSYYLRDNRYLRIFRNNMDDPIYRSVISMEDDICIDENGIIQGKAKSPEEVYARLQRIFGNVQALKALNSGNVHSRTGDPYYAHNTAKSSIEEIHCPAHINWMPKFVQALSLSLAKPEVKKAFIDAIVI